MTDAYAGKTPKAPCKSGRSSWRTSSRLPTTIQRSGGAELSDFRIGCVPPPPRPTAFPSRVSYPDRSTVAHLGARCPRESNGRLPRGAQAAAVGLRPPNLSPGLLVALIACDCATTPMLQRRGSTGSDSRARTANTASWTRHSGSPRATRSSDSMPSANSRAARERLWPSPRVRRRSRLAGSV